MRFALTLVMLLIWPTWSLAQSDNVYCQFDSARGAIACIKLGDSAPMFEYKLANLNIAQLDEIVSETSKRDRSNLAGEQCRTRTEVFRTSKIEDKFRVAIEGLRVAAEGIRKDALHLYNQVMIVYHGLFDRYGTGIEAYKNTIKSCVRITPFEVHPKRFSSKSRRNREHS